MYHAHCSALQCEREIECIVFVSITKLHEFVGFSIKCPLPTQKYLINM